MKIGDSTVRLRRAGDVPSLRVSVKNRQVRKLLGNRNGGFWADYGETSFRSGRGTYAQKKAPAVMVAYESLAASLSPLPPPVPLVYASYGRRGELVLVDELGGKREG